MEVSTTELSARKIALGAVSQSLQNQIAKLRNSPQEYQEAKDRLERVNEQLRAIRTELTERVQARINEQKEYEPPLTKNELVRRVMSIMETLRRDIVNSSNAAEKFYKSQILKQLDALWGTNATKTI